MRIRQTRSEVISLTNNSATSPEIEFADYGGGRITNRSGAALTVTFFEKAPDGAVAEMEDIAALVIADDSSKAIPADAFGAHVLVLVADVASADVAITLKA